MDVQHVCTSPPTPRQFARPVRADGGVGRGGGGRQGARVVVSVYPVRCSGDWGRRVDGATDALRGRAESVTAGVQC